MTQERLYRLSVGLPLVVPVLLAPVTYLGLEAGGPWGDLVSGAAGFFIWASAIAAIPYCMLAAPLLWRFRGSPASAYRRFSFVAPLVFAAFLWLWFSAFLLPQGDLAFHQQLLLAGAYAAFALPVGYAYVLLAHVLLALLRRLGTVR
jgi:hypothetical protein